MSATSFATTSLAEIATSLPGATGLFRRHKLDFCCNGQVPLADAAAAKGLDLAELEAELGTLASQARPVAPPENPAALIDLIETRYHAGHRRDLPELARLARRVEAVHKAHPAVPHGLAQLLDVVAADLEAHMQKEEQVLFPLMRRGGHPMIVHPLAAMRADHDEHGAHLRELERLTDGFVPPEGACATWRALYVGAQSFADELVEHIHTENNLLFPRFAA